MSENKSNGILNNNTLVPIGAVTCLFVFLSTLTYKAHSWVVQDTLWKSKVDSTLKSLDSRIVGKGPNGWHRKDMKNWVLQLKLSNPTIEVPEVPKYEEN